MVIGLGYFIFPSEVPNTGSATILNLVADPFLPPKLSAKSTRLLSPSSLKNLVNLNSFLMELLLNFQLQGPA